jgi:hypothetical protein
MIATASGTEIHVEPQRKPRVPCWPLPARHDLMEDSMTRTTTHSITAAASLALAACASSGAATPPPSGQGELPPGYVRDVYTGKPIKDSEPVKEWPLRFKSHTFSAACYDTYRCEIWYARHQQRNDPPDRLLPSSASYGPDYQRTWSTSGHGGIPNFPPPAEVSWRSKDGQAHEAKIDIAALFADELIRHNVAREDMGNLPDGEYRHEPAIILEINDRTIRVWMLAFIPTKEPQIPGNQYSDARTDPILIKTYTF